MSDERTANAVDKRLGERVRRRRLELGMSQEHLADVLGVTFQQVQKYEKGVNRIAASRLFDVAAALDMPVAHFFEGLSKGGGKRTEANAATAGFERVLATPEGIQLMKSFASISSLKLRRRVVELVKALSEEES